MKRIKVFGLCFVFTCLLVGCQSPVIRPEVERIIQRIGRSYTPGAVGYEGRLTHQDEFINTLEQVATVGEPCFVRYTESKLSASTTWL